MSEYYPQIIIKNLKINNIKNLEEIQNLNTNKMNLFRTHIFTTSRHI